MKIGILLDQITLGGPPKATFEEVRYLRKMGYDAELIVVFERETKEYCYEDLTEDIPIKYLSRKFPSLFRFSFKFPFFSFFSSFHLTSPIVVSRTIKNSEYDVLVSHGSYTCFTALKLLKNRDIPYVAYIWDPITYILPRVYSSSILKYGFPILKPLAYYLDNLFTTNSVATLTCSNAHVKSLNEISDTQPYTLYPGCFPMPSIPEKRGDYILSLTKWDIGKNPEFLIKVLKKINKKVRLVVAGNWVQESVYENFMRKVDEENLKDQVEVTGFADTKTQQKLYSEARVLIHPIFEAFGMFGLEAASCGCPIIIPQGSGVTDLFTHGVHGFFPAEGDVEKYAEYIDKLLDDERLAWKMGYEAWKVAKNNTWENHTKRLIKILESTLNARKN